MYKVISFTRVSSQHQDLVQQNQEVYKSIINHGYKDDEILYIEQKESAIKLSIEERQSVQQLFSYVKQYDTIEFVFIYEISRLSRQSKMLYEIRDFLIEHKVNLHCIKPEMTLLDSDGKMSQTASIMFSIFSSISESEMMIKKERMRRGAEYKKQRGLHSGGPLAIGYTTDKNDKIIIEEEGAAIVRRIFNDYANGISIRQLARNMQDEGWRPKTSFLTICQSLLNILHREYYCGDKWHPQIISRELFNKCKEMAAHKTIHKTKNQEALLKGLIYDKATGYLLSGNMCNKSRTYYCKRYGHTTISMKAADTLIEGLAKEWYNQISEVKIDEMKNEIEKEIQRQKKIVKQQEDNITKNQDKIDRIEERYINDKISKEKADELEKKAFEDMQYYRNTLDEANDKIKYLENELKNVKPNIHSLRDKILYVVDRIYISRVSRFVCEIIVINKFTGEQRTYLYNTRLMTILNMKVILRPSLNWNGK